MKVLLYSSLEARVRRLSAQSVFYAFILHPSAFILSYILHPSAFILCYAAASYLDR